MVEGGRCISAWAVLLIEYAIEVGGAPPAVVGMLLGGMEVLVYGAPGRAFEDGVWPPGGVCVPEAAAALAAAFAAAACDFFR